MTKTELVKVILFLLGAFACAMGIMDYIASTASPWRAAFWILVFAMGFLVFIFFFCRVLALLMLRVENRDDGEMPVSPRGISPRSISPRGINPRGINPGGKGTSDL